MSNQHEGDPRDIEPAYASDDWASRRGYEIAMAWGDSHEHRIGQADEIAHEFRKLRDHMQAQIDALRQELAAGQETLSLDEILADVVQWGKQTFPKGTDYGIITHMSRELRELVQNPSDGQEMADILILLTHLAAYHGVDLKGEVIAKMIVNRQREWGEPDEAGVIEHRRKHTEQE